MKSFCNYNLFTGSPPAFSCHKTDSHTSETKVFYSDCSISTPGMDSNTGIFLVKEAGVYQITFTGFFVSLRGHMVKFVTSLSKLKMNPLQVSADIYLRTGDKDEIIGRSSAKTDEDGVFGSGSLFRCYIHFLCLHFILNHYIHIKLNNI